MTSRDEPHDLTGTQAVHHRVRGAPVVVGIDGSEEAQRGLRFAADLAVTLGTELVVVHALGMYRHAGGWRDSEGDREAEAADQIAETWCASLASIDTLVWRWQVVHGPAVDALIRAADDADAALIVVGTHGVGKSDEPLLGSTSHWVVRNSNRPVLIVPPPDNHAHRRPGAGAGAMTNVVADQ